jgi:small subunit ribosomal protein S1
VGDEVEVYVLNVDADRQRVALSMKRLEQDPWEAIDEMYQVGQLVEVTVTKLARYGAFAAINDDYGLEGLIHISEMSEEHIKHPSEVVERHELTTARIIRIDPEQRQIGLSLKQVTSNRYLDVDLAMADRYDEDESEYGN